MREMTDSDLDKLAGELGDGQAGNDVGKVGLIVPEGSEPRERITTEEEGIKAGSGLTVSLGTTGDGTSKEEVGEALRSAGTVDGLIAAVEKGEGKEKVD